MTPWETLSIDQVLDRLQLLVDKLPEAERMDARVGLQVLSDHIFETNSELADLDEQEAP